MFTENVDIFFYLFKKRFYLFLEREERKEKKGEKR